MCNTSQCKLRFPFRNLRVMNIICIVTHYTLPPFGSLDSFWIMRSQRSRRRDEGLWGLGVYVSANISVTKEHAPTLIALRVGVGVQFPKKKHYLILEWPLMLQKVRVVEHPRQNTFPTDNILGCLTGVACSLHAQDEVRDIVERVEHSEHVHSTLHCLLTESGDITT